MNHESWTLGWPASHVVGEGWPSDKPCLQISIRSEHTFHNGYPVKITHFIPVLSMAVVCASLSPFIVSGHNGRSALYFQVFSKHLGHGGTTRSILSTQLYPWRSEILILFQIIPSTHIRKKSKRMLWYEDFVISILFLIGRIYELFRNNSYKSWEVSKW